MKLQLGDLSEIKTLVSEGFFVSQDLFHMFLEILGIKRIPDDDGSLVFLPLPAHGLRSPVE